jgi:hypothetical protein
LIRLKAGPDLGDPPTDGAARRRQVFMRYVPWPHCGLSARSRILSPRPCGPTVATADSTIGG